MMMPGARLPCTQWELMILLIFSRRVASVCSLWRVAGLSEVGEKKKVHVALIRVLRMPLLDLSVMKKGN